MSQGKIFSREDELKWDQNCIVKQDAKLFYKQKSFSIADSSLTTNTSKVVAFQDAVVNQYQCNMY